jgi:hypothetical protein
MSAPSAPARPGAAPTPSARPRAGARPAAAVAAGLVVVLAGGVSRAVTYAGRPSASPAARAGHPGSPVVVRDAAFRVTGRAGSVVHVRLRAALDVPFRTDTPHRFTLTGTGDFAAVTLYPEAGDGPHLEVSTVAPRRACGQPACANATLYSSEGSASQLPPGDYMLALAGTPGSTVSYTLRGFTGHEPVTTVTHLYAVPYASAPIPAAPAAATDAVYPTGHGRWVTPTIGRRMLSGVVLATHLPNGGGYSFSLCPGAKGARSTQADATAAARPSCTGYTTAQGAVVSRDPLAHPLPGSDDEYVDVLFTSAMATTEGVTGGSFAGQCNQPGCAFAAFAYALALDS